MVDFLRTCFRVSIRRACKAIPVRRATYHDRSRRPEQAALRRRIREIAETRTRYGYRRIHFLLRGEGWPINAKRVYRLYKLENLQMRHKPPRRRVSVKLREDRKAPASPNDVWAIDFLSDQLFDGSKIRILTIVDVLSRLSPAIDARQRYKGADVVATLERVTAIYGLPECLRVDRGSEFVS